MDFAQLGIMLFGAVAIILTQAERASVRRYACLFGVLGQPFWFWTAYTHQQWGIFMMCFLYSYGWLKGLYAFWLKPWRQSMQNPPVFDDWIAEDDQPY